MGLFRAIVFDVDHGFCTFIRSPNGYTLLIDCGRGVRFSPVDYIADNELAGTAQYNGYALTQLVISHPHEDHLADIGRLQSRLRPAILFRQRYDWNELKVGAGEFGYEPLDAYAQWQTAYNQDVVSPPDWGMAIQHCCYLSPQEAKAVDPARFANNSSIAVAVEYKGYKFFFAGDLEEAAWKILLRRASFKSMLQGTSFFVTSHHGHRSGYCREIYDVMRKPYFNFASVSHGDDSTEPAYSSPESARGVAYGGRTRYSFTTRADGSLAITIDEQGKCTFGFHRFANNA